MVRNRLGATFAAALILLVPVGEAAAQGAAPPVPASPAVATGTGGSTRGKNATERVERYITDLHRRLGVKPAQQGAWDGFAAVMRANAARQEAEYEHRRTAGLASAVDDLRGYAESERARAGDIDRLVPAFEALYAAMDPPQRANADRVFQEVQRRRPR